VQPTVRRNQRGRAPGGWWSGSSVLLMMTATVKMKDQSDNAAVPSRTTVRIPTASGDELEAWVYLPRTEQAKHLTDRGSK
jgi:hypothetical protein